MGIVVVAFLAAKCARWTPGARSLTRDRHGVGRLQQRRHGCGASRSDEDFDPLRFGLVKSLSHPEGNLTTSDGR